MSQDEIIAMARQAGMSDAEYGPHCTPGMYAHNMEIIHRFAALVAAKEREECAQVCESRVTPGTGSVAILGGAADAIRARGTQ